MDTIEAAIETMDTATVRQPVTESARPGAGKPMQDYRLSFSKLAAAQAATAGRAPAAQVFPAATARPAPDRKALYALAGSYLTQTFGAVRNRSAFPLEPALTDRPAHGRRVPRPRRALRHSAAPRSAGSVPHSPQRQRGGLRGQDGPGPRLRRGPAGADRAGRTAARRGSRPDPGAGHPQARVRSARRS